MTRITLLRHAKSSWDHPELSDMHRPLNGRGERAAALMGTICAERLPVPDFVILSPSVRTKSTVRLFLEAWSAVDKRAGSAEILEMDELYLAGRSDWIQAMKEISSRGNHVVGCGHQPGIGDFASWLDSNFHGDVPTGAVLSFPVSEGFFSEQRGSYSADFIGRPKEFG